MAEPTPILDDAEVRARFMFAGGPRFGQVDR